MIAGGGLYVSRSAAKALITVLELADMLADQLEAFKHMDEENLLEVKLAKALLTARLLGAHPDHIHNELAQGAEDAGDHRENQSSEG